MMLRRHLIYIYVGVAGMLAACTGNKVYDKYEHTPIAGWEKNDSLTFDIPRMKAPGTYQAQLGLRINGAYPFMGLTLIVRQTVYPGQRTRTDTLRCQLIDENGNAYGQGVNFYQYHYLVNALTLRQGDSLHVSVRHDMKREILPGIADVGFQLSKLH